MNPQRADIQDRAERHVIELYSRHAVLFGQGFRLDFRAVSVKVELGEMAWRMDGTEKRARVLCASLGFALSTLGKGSVGIHVEWLKNARFSAVVVELPDQGWIAGECGRGSQTRSFVFTPESAGASECGNARCGG